jgi:hypothetical protein
MGAAYYTARTALSEGLCRGAHTHAVIAANAGGPVSVGVLFAVVAAQHQAAPRDTAATPPTRNGVYHPHPSVVAPCPRSPASLTRRNRRPALAPPTDTQQVAAKPPDHAPPPLLPQLSARQRPARPRRSVVGQRARGPPGWLCGAQRRHGRPRAELHAAAADARELGALLRELRGLPLRHEHECLLCRLSRGMPPVRISPRVGQDARY